FYSSGLASSLADRERQRMVLWADAVAEVLRASDASSVGFPMRLVEDNTGIPALLCDGGGGVLMSRNLPEDSLAALKMADKILSDGNEISIEAEQQGVVYRIYYGDSDLLKTLRRFPYIELGVILFFLIITYFAVRASRKAEENRIWVGLSRETAHQLGTPISSLMGWIECLKSDPSQTVVTEAVSEMQRDVDRLADVSARFSKIGSCPPMAQLDIAVLVQNVADYMRRRVSSGIAVVTELPDVEVIVTGSSELLRWVLENLVKNAADAMDGVGQITIALRKVSDGGAVIDVTDTGKGIPRNRWRGIFKAGYTTKGRGWGLGLTLARRIVEQYHRGSISVVASVIGGGTTFRVILP
ncbi:MAG: ATP-binding protein, partial [Muribaculaceae bacterium]|nr:ATP-binding protein [Muribaculaceae bacterium]